MTSKLSPKIFQIAIDGPAASGKSSTASLVARKLGFAYIDSGAIYRALTWKAIQEGVEPADPENLPKILEILERIHFSYRIDESTMNMTDAQGNTIVKKRPVFIVQMDGKDAPDVEIRTPIISQKVSKIAKVPEFRKIIVQCQRLFASQLPTNLQHNGRTLSQDDPYFGGVVMDGRDIGSVVLSHAQIKIFMVADPKVRAQRRLEEILKAAKNKQDADSIDREAVLQDLIHRDHEDENRQASPLIQSQGSIVLDSSTMELDDRVNFITDLVLKEWPGVASQLASN